jgi:hypothetical protein
MKHRLTVVVAVLSIFCAWNVAASPVLNFSDLVSGPSSGNGDTSLGQVAGQDGVIVTLWGTNLGASQGSSKVFINGAEARVYSWGNATAPADLYTRHKLQMVCCQVSHSAASGAGTIYVVVNGVQSNTLPFTVRAGKIYFVKTSGNDTTGDGSWSKPWQTIPNAVHNISSGDTIYVCDGVAQTVEDTDNAAVNLNTEGTATMPNAVVTYPGAHVVVGTATVNLGFRNWWDGHNTTTDYWVISKFDTTAMTIPIDGGNGFRIIGNRVTAPNGNQPEGAIEGGGNNLFVLGNEVTNTGFYGCTKLYHPIYISSARASSGPRLPTESNREIAWNYLHDNFSYDGINIYSEDSSTAFMTGHKVHDNYIINQTGRGMLIGYYMTGENWIYNNVIDHGGLGPDPTDGSGDRATAAGVHIDAGQDSKPATTIHFWNNTIYGCGWSGASYGTDGAVLLENLSWYTLDFKNNIIVSTGEPFVSNASEIPANAAFNNLWFGAGAAPSWDTAAINADPKFVNASGGDFHLQSGSPAIDKGLSSVLPTVSVDFDNIPRPQGAGIDLGAFEFVSGSPPPPPLPPSIVTQPVNQTVNAGQTATFSVTASGTALLSYQWQKNGANISSAVSSSYTTPPTAAGDNAAAFRCVVSNSAGTATSNSATLTVIVVNNQSPVITSSANASPNPALGGQTVTFSVSASDSDGDALNYTWDFGDMAQGSGTSPTHQYTTAGTFLATVTVSDGHGGSTTSSISVTISTVSSPPPIPLTVTKLSGKVVFSSAGHDSCQFAGSVSNIAPFTLNGTVFSVDIAGAAVSFTLNKKGTGKSHNGTISVRPKNGTVTVNARLKNGSWATAWAAYSITNATQTRKSLTLPVSVTFNSVSPAGTRNVLYSAKAGRAGTFK